MKLPQSTALVLLTTFSLSLVTPLKLTPPDSKVESQVTLYICTGSNWSGQCYNFFGSPGTCCKPQPKSSSSLAH